jgi:hypothetical protein
MAANMNVANLFDAIRQFRKRFTLLNLRFFQEHYDLERIARIVGDEKRPEVELLKSSEMAWRDITRFDVKVDEEPVSPTERMDLIEKLTRTGSIDMWLNQKFVDFESALDLMPHIPESIKRQILERNGTLQRMEADFQAQVAQVQAQLEAANAQLNILNGVISMSPAAGEIQQTIEVQMGIHQQITAMEKIQPQQGQQGPQQGPPMGMPPGGGMPPR